MEFVIQPFGVLVGLAVTGVFTGVGLAFGNIITKYWLEPKVKRWKQKHSRIVKRFRKNGGLLK